MSFCPVCPERRKRGTDTMYKALMTIDRYLTKIVEIILTLLFIAIFIMVFYQVILRYLFNSSIFGTAEIYTVLFAYASALGSAVMLRDREHIKIDILLNAVPRPVGKALLTISYALIALFSYFIVQEAIPWLSKIRTFRSPVTGISRTLESVCIPIGFGLILFYCLVNVLSLYINPAEAEQEFSASEKDITDMIDHSKRADEEFQDRHGKDREA